MSATTPFLVSLWLAAFSPSPTRLEYTLRVDPAQLSSISVEMRVRFAPANLQLAAHAHPEYDDKYWRYLEQLQATDASGKSISISPKDSVLWQLKNAAGDVIVRYRIRLPEAESPRDSWKPFLSATGALVGGPHSLLYVVGAESSPATVTLDIPRNWKVATGLPGASSARTFTAPDVFTLMESPMLVGNLSEWKFATQGVPHRIFYRPLPNATPFDTIAFARGIERLTAETFKLFGSAPYSSYTFMIQDGAYSGGLEHPNSVTIGGASRELATDPYATMPELAHEFFHTWNLMSFKPIEYRGVDFRVQPPVAGLWFSEGLTLFYADLLLRRAGLPTSAPTRAAHLESLITRYLSNPGNSVFSAEAVSRVAYNASPSALGDYNASAHLQGELIGAMLDMHVRSVTNGTRSMDDVMRTFYDRFKGRGFVGTDVQRVVEEVCSCSVADIFVGHVSGASAIDFNRYLAPLGMRMSVTWEPAVDPTGKPSSDLRIWAWQEGGDTLVHLRVLHPQSLWAVAGLHTGDRLVSINGKAVKSWPEFRTFLTAFQIGDSAKFVVQRPTGRFETTVTMKGVIRPVVKVESHPSANEAQRRLREAWVAGR